ncbi:MAG: SH3 domain-containing protein [Saprospiraceae bacterium]|nr:SH3 domain-containing protein [Saprospiraceae bacterium]
MTRLYLIAIAFLGITGLLGAQDTPPYGILVNNSQLHTDSSFSTATSTLAYAGEKVIILESTASWLEDDSQKQLFPWWKVQTSKGDEGWVFGDALAVRDNKENLPQGLHASHESQIDFGRGFETSELWFGVIAGSDMAAGLSILPKSYLETYLVITNPDDACIFLPLSGESTFGKTVVDFLDICETTGDDRPEIIVQKISKGIEDDESSTWIDVFSFQGGSFKKVFGEVLEGDSRDDIHLDFSNGSIQSAMLKETEDTWELFSQTWFWNAGKKSFEILYPEKRSILKATSLRSSLHFTESPYGFLRGQIEKEEEFYIQGFQKKSGTLFAQILTSLGKRGFVPYDQCQIKDFLHVSWLNQRLEEKSIKGPIFSKR